MYAIVVYTAHNNYLLCELHEHMSPNSLVMLEALLYFEGRLLILAPNSVSTMLRCVV